MTDEIFDGEVDIDISDDDGADGEALPAQELLVAIPTAAAGSQDANELTNETDGSLLLEVRLASSSHADLLKIHTTSTCSSLQ